MKNKPKILIYDLETFPDLVTSWGLRVFGYLSPDNIVQERTIICASWKWLGKRGVTSVCVTPSSPTDDRGVVQVLCDVIREADAIVAHNGDSFDIRWLNARAIYHGLLPLPPVIQIDTKRIAKKKFLFNSNKLAYLAEFFKIGSKIKTEFALWKQCLAGDAKALEKMVRYNRRDIVILEKVYKRLIPYVPAKINARLFTTREACSHCGSTEVQSRGFAYTAAHKYRKFQCTSCGGWYRSNKAEKAGTA